MTLCCAQDQYLTLPSSERLLPRVNGICSKESQFLNVVKMEILEQLVLNEMPLPNPSPKSSEVFGEEETGTF